MLRAPGLQPGDMVGIVSPAWGGAGLYPHRVDRGIKHLQALGFKVKTGEYALNHNGPVSDTAEHRTADIHSMFADPQIKAIIAAVGGNHSCHLLPLLDFNLIRQQPKVFMGFSDITVLNVAIWQQTGLVTFNGPALLTDFAEVPRMFKYTETYWLKAVSQAQPIGLLAPSTWWTEEFLDWAEKADLTRPRRKQASSGWQCLKAGSGEGTLIGGCLESLEHLRGTRFWPQWQDSIMFFETSEGAPPPSRVDSILMDYENMGVLAQLKGMLIGRPMRYTDAMKQQLREVVLERTRHYNFPIISDMDFGHTAPQFTLPIGCRARIEAENKQFEIIDAAVR